MSDFSNEELFERASVLMGVVNVGEAQEMNAAYKANDLELLEALVSLFENRMKPLLIKDIFHVV